MAVHRLRKGLDLPLAGEPEQHVVVPGPEISRVAVMGDDTPGVRARMAISEGDQVKRGQLLFEDRTRPGVRYTAPGAGRVAAIFRGHRRMLRSVVIQLTESERVGSPTDADCVALETWREAGVADWTGEQVRALLVESGLWTALRQRPFGKVPLPESSPRALFVTAIDTNPCAADPDPLVQAAYDDFQRGLQAVSKLCDGPVYLCVRKGSEIRSWGDDRVSVEQFQGPHPAGNPGVHIHRLAPVSRHRSAWHLGYQDVIAVGRLLATGRLPVERVVALGGPMVKEPRLVQTRLGASLDELLRDGLLDGDVRVISGSVLSGKRAMGPELGFLGRHHLQVSAVLEGRARRLFGWLAPGAEDFSATRTFVSKLMFWKRFDMTTDTNGSHRPIMPLGTYERVMPMDIVATYLLRSLVVGDIEQAEALGALELDEEDLALCTFVCPGKNEFGPYLRKNLERIEKEG